MDEVLVIAASAARLWRDALEEVEWVEKAVVSGSNPQMLHSAVSSFQDLDDQGEGRCWYLGSKTYIVLGSMEASRSLSEGVDVVD
jgi:hypothetical protein